MATPCVVLGLVTMWEQCAPDTGLTSVPSASAIASLPVTEDFFDPTNPDLLTHPPFRWTSLYYLGKLTGLAERYNAALKKDAGDTKARQGLAQTYRRLGRTRELNSLLDLWGRYAPEELEALMESPAGQSLTR